MFKSLQILIVLLICATKVLSQSKTAEFDSYDGFSKGTEAVGYHLRPNIGYRVNLQLINKIVRNRYDNEWNLKDSYEYQTQDYTLNNSYIGTPVFICDLQLEKGVYEIYADKKTVLVVTTDFQQKKDSLKYFLDLKNQESREKMLAVMPHAKGLRILTFSNREDKLFMYNWQENGQVDTVEFPLPESSLSPDEIKKYTKSAKVKYRSAFDDLIVSRANSVSAIGFAGKNYVYYTDDKIWLALQTPLYTGYNIIELDINKKSLSSTNYMINDMRKNAEAKNEGLKTPYALIWKNYLIVRNSSYYFFQYQFYNLNTRELVKEYTITTADSLQEVINSDLTQKGTWISGGAEKKLHNENAYLRKLGAGDGFIFLSDDQNDSITITTGSIKKIQGPLVSVINSAFFIAKSGSISIADFFLTSFLRIYKDKLVYNHSCFSASTFEVSPSKNVYKTIDLLLDNFERRDIKSNSSFIIQKEGKYMVAVLNTESKKFELYNLLHE